jgi:succinyl-CoA synthetase beta subunit
MNIYEYQAKSLFKHYGIPIPEGKIAQEVEDISRVLEDFGEGAIVVKAQIHAGGRNLGVFKDGLKGGVKIARTKSEARELGSRMLKNRLVTHQTPPEGKLVDTVYFTEVCSVKKEYYLAIILDRASACPVMIASQDGGVDIEGVAKNNPERIIKIFIDPAFGLQAHHKRSINFFLGFDKILSSQLDSILTKVYKLFRDKDVSLVEINPLIVNTDDKLIALDAKLSFDDNALFRHPGISSLKDISKENPRELEATQHNLSYIALDGNIACLVNGAGLAMATLDIIKHFNGNPANFLDIGGAADKQQICSAFKIILSDPRVKAILVNIFGGIVKCDVIAKGIISAAKDMKIDIPFVVRLEGTHAQQGKELLAQSGLAIIPADSLHDAAQKVVQQVETEKMAFCL